MVTDNAQISRIGPAAVRKWSGHGATRRTRERRRADNTHCHRLTNANSDVPSLQSHDVVEVTHPFHPWRARVFRVHSEVTVGRVPLVRCVVDPETVRSLPRAWTDRRAVDDFERVSAGRSLFRADDLVALRALVDTLIGDRK